MRHFAFYQDCTSFSVSWPTLTVFFFYLFLAALGLRRYSWAFSSCSELRLLFICCARASHCGSFSWYRRGSRAPGHQWLWHMASAAPWLVESSTRGQACVPCIDRWIPNQWTAGGSLIFCFFFDSDHSVGCEVMPHCGFDLHFPDDR